MKRKGRDFERLGQGLWRNRRGTGKICTYRKENVKRLLRDYS
jgi:hypothetical protein